MENLEEKASGFSIEINSESKPLTYQGLNLVESANYDNGGTSIKYWI